METGVLFFAPPASDHEHWVTRATDGFRIWSVVRSPEERNTMLIMFIFVAVALFSAIWTHSVFWIFFFGVQIAFGKVLLIRRFLTMARQADYDVEMGLTSDDLQLILSRCNLTN